MKIEILSAAGTPPGTSSSTRANPSGAAGEFCSLAVVFLYGGERCPYHTHQDAIKENEAELEQHLHERAHPAGNL